MGVRGEPIQRLGHVPAIVWGRRVFRQGVGWQRVLAPPFSNHSGPCALARLWAQPRGFWAVIPDLNMPVMSGLVLARYVREMAPHVAVVLVTGYLDEVTPDNLSDAGITAVLSKPYGLADLEAALGQVRARNTG